MPGRSREVVCNRSCQRCGHQRRRCTLDIPLAEVTFHIDQETTPGERESLRDVLLSMDGVVAVGCHDDKPHLMLIEYRPDRLSAVAFVDAAKRHGLHAELIGL